MRPVAIDEMTTKKATMIVRGGDSATGGGQSGHALLVSVSVHADVVPSWAASRVDPCLSLEKTKW